MSSHPVVVGVIVLTVVAAIGPIGFVERARAATLVVDDDGVECPGAGHTTIGSAVSSATTDDTIKVCAGSYNETVTVDVENVTLVADGAAVMDANATRSTAIKVRADDVTIDGFELRDYTGQVVLILHGINGFGDRVDRTTITNNTIWISGEGADIGTSGIVSREGGFDQAGRGTTITNNVIKDAPGGPSNRGVGVDIRDNGGHNNENTRIENNTIVARDLGIRLGGRATGSVIRNNTVTVHQDSGGGDWGISVQAVRTVEVTGNNVTVFDSDIPGISASVDGAGGLIIENNSVTGGEDGIEVVVTFSASSSPNNPIVVRSNFVTNTAGDGIRVNDVDSTRLIDNTVVNPGDRGMVLTNADDLNATGNLIFGGLNGIRVDDSGTAVIANNYLDGNEFGLNFRPDTRFATATGNVIMNGSTGIRAEGLTDSRLRDTVVSNASSQEILWIGSTPNTTVENLTLDSALVSFEAEDVTLRAVDTPPGDPVGKGNIGQYVEATASSASAFVNLTVNYTDASAVDVNESTLAFWTFDGSTWSKVPTSTVDTTTNRVAADITSFSIFAPLGTLDDSSPPQLIGSTPADDTTDVARDTDVTLRFNETVRVGSGYLSINKTADDSTLDSVFIGAANVTVSGRNVTWNRTNDLPAGTDVYLYVPDGTILDGVGNVWSGIQDNSTLDFTTETVDTAPPKLVGSTPVDGATAVVRDTDVTLRFNETVQTGNGHLSINKTADNSTLDNVSVSTSTVTVSGRNVTWNRSRDLPSGTIVYVYISDGAILDSVGNVWSGIQDNSTLDFTTETIDTDGDGLTDSTEFGLGTDVTNPDTDSDGIDDSIETNGGSAIDTDGDSTIDALDLDSDGDGKPDSSEGIGDVDGDGTPNWRDPDDATSSGGGGGGSGSGGGGGGSGSSAIENTIPTVTFSYTPTSPTVDTPVEFDASESSDPDGTIVEYRWDFDDNSGFDARGPGQRVVHTFSTVGEFTVTLSVLDDDDDVATTTKTVSVMEPTSSSTSASTVAPVSTSSSTADSNPTSDTTPMITPTQTAIATAVPTSDASIAPTPSTTDETTGTPVAEPGGFPFRILLLILALVVPITLLAMYRQRWGIG